MMIAAGLELEFFGSEPFVFSSTSVYPSLSSSGSVISGSPSPSVSLCTVISIVLVIVFPSGLVTTTGISNLRVSSVVPQSVTSGVPLIVFVVGSYVTPFGNLLVSTVTVDAGSPGVITIFEIGFSSITVCVGFVIVGCGVGGVVGLEFGSFGSVPFALSSISVYPSLSSSVSVTSGSPSWSVSRCTVILKVLVVVLPAVSVAVTVTVISRVSSVDVQSVTVGVPVIFFVVGSYVTPLGKLFTVTVAFGLSTVTVIGLIGLPSTTVWSEIGVIEVVGLEFGSLGSVPLAISSVSGYPSPSSSISVTSGSPSPSVSLCTVILKVFVDVLPASSLASIVTVNSRFSSVGVQSVTVGVPVIFFVVGSYVTPLGKSFTVIVAFESSVVTVIS